MNFLALFLGLGAERLLTHLFHLRKFHWLDPVFDIALHKLRDCGLYIGMLASLGVTVLVVLPVAVVEFGLQDRLAHVPQFVFAVIVLLFCLGPRDLAEEVNDYRSAVALGGEDEAQELETELLEGESGQKIVPDIEEAIYAQANNRIFAVVFWFALLGPTAAWFFRVLDLMRRRAIHHGTEYAGGEEIVGLPAITRSALALHQIAAWVPAHLLMVGYALAGSFEGAVAAWKQRLEDVPYLFPGPTGRRLGMVGKAAAPTAETDDDATRAACALRLVVRTLWMIWCPALALLTLYGSIN
jgi:membrane protein required for beta-lactamase induction